MHQHELKTDPAVFEAVMSGAKTHEIRLNDRNFDVGDVLLLRETIYTGAEMAKGAELLYTGRETRRTVSHIQTGYGLVDGWCILSFDLGTEELAYATRLARHLYSLHYSATAPEWKPAHELMGVLSQIDNMLAGLKPSAPESLEQPPLELPPLNEDLLAILGRPNFTCIGIAHRMRQLGHVIENRAENEQAAVLYMLLGLYLKHGAAWAEKGDEYLNQKPATAGTTNGEPA
jgi:hypothetical protein